MVFTEDLIDKLPVLTNKTAVTNTFVEWGPFDRRYRRDDLSHFAVTNVGRIAGT